jgi:RNA polymerase sigma-70 factor (ECF subfamily)
MPDGFVVRPWATALSRPAQWTVSVVRPEEEAAPVSLATADDQTLVTACLAGHHAAFEVIVERHRRSVYQICYRFVGNHEDASDLSQDTFVKAWRGLSGFKGQAQLSTWLYRIAVNTCLNRVQSKALPTERIEHDAYEDSTTDDPGTRVLRDERGRAVRRAIARLPEKQRATLILRSYQDLSHREIADVLGSSVGAVKANFFHALANLKKLLGSEP